MDWTDFDADDQTTLVFSLVTNHGRAHALAVVLRVQGGIDGKAQRHRGHVPQSGSRRRCPTETKVTILADRGFGDAKLFGFLEELGFDYVIRFRGDIFVTAADGETRRAEDWVGVGGRARKLADAEIIEGKAEGRRGRLRQGQGHEGSLASGGERRRRRRRARSSTYILGAGP